MVHIISDITKEISVTLRLTQERLATYIFPLF